MQLPVSLVNQVFTILARSEAASGSRSIQAERGLPYLIPKAWAQSVELLSLLPTQISFTSELARPICEIQSRLAMACTSLSMGEKPGNISDWRTHDRLIAFSSIQRTLIWFTLQCSATFMVRIRIVVFTEQETAAPRGRRSSTRTRT